MLDDTKKSKAPQYDVVVIGAGIQGAGVAQAAALQGWRVLVLEQYEKPAMGTSSKSSKLIHGGLRYLETAQFSLVKECLQEKRLLQQLAPQLVKPISFLIPIYKTSKRGAFWVRLGLWLYALLGSKKPKSYKKAQWSNLALLSQQGLKSVLSYEDAQTDDALLTQAVLNSARNLGADIQFNAQVSSITQNKNDYTLRFNNQNVSTRVLVNAAGPWVNQVKSLCNSALPDMQIELIQGAHIVLDVPAKPYCFYLESPDDGRAMFVIPWKDKTMVGTTEHLYTGNPSDVKATEEEIAYLTRGFEHYFPSHQGAKQLDAFAGLRVLPKSNNAANKRVRDTKIVRMVSGSPTQSAGYYAIYGGKLTGYRATAEKVIKKVALHFDQTKPLRSTKNISL